jgi:hypothetical protein
MWPKFNSQKEDDKRNLDGMELIKINVCATTSTHFPLFFWTGVALKFIL